ncbi:hypothetical protein [Geomesophilobacter sediminis]|uniref:Uncharacterized protein n=1 Tax=Geomesophilobacter sediminis TaxID=2798584 RepID=A0A8J7M2R7_9BACT|nr:hypothetical protein [Geomesophilobacter sediminis]MBJ6727233.1 hypothetical protein [Geomesophilobacter sediminis]
MKTESISVECYAGYKADERPTSFVFAGRDLEIEAIVDRWYDVDGNYFKVRADDGMLYLLRHDLEVDGWELVLPDGEAG